MIKIKLLIIINIIVGEKKRKKQKQMYAVLHTSHADTLSITNNTTG